ncbi:MAG: response regulator transcription factor [Clostridiales bacterium]|nr:response regulator transcription factor [Eubacteriales bacterium]MDD6054792.1 response regulator transcription factor [Clostridiales bacterium]
MKKILIVDDEQGIRENLKMYLEYNENDGFEVTCASDGLEAVKLCENQNFDLVIMDIMMPKMDGMTALKEIRKTQNVPVIVLSARGEEYDKLFCFEMGADDYVTKPFSAKEVVARVKAILNRSGRSVEKERDTRTFGGLVIDFEGRNVIVDKKKVDMTPKEYEVLFFLVRNEGKAVSREKLLSNVWGFDFYGDDRTVDTHIKMLRSNLGPYRNCIVTLRGLGYKFEYEQPEE